MTGLSEKALKRQGIAYEKVYVHPASHAGYYPGAAQMSLKLLFDPESGKILGAQAVGRRRRRQADRRAGRRHPRRADRLRSEEQELSYAPPYGSAKDPINYAGFVAANVLRGDVRICHVEDVLDAGRRPAAPRCAHAGRSRRPARSPAR